VSDAARAKALRGLLPLRPALTTAGVLYEHFPADYSDFMHIFPLHDAKWRQCRPRIAQMDEDVLSLCICMLASIVEVGDAHLFHPTRKEK